MDILHGKPIDIQKLKQPVLSNLQKHLDQVRATVSYLSERERPVRQDACYVCGGTDRRPFAVIHGFEYVECSACSHVYTALRYDAEALGRFYAANAYYSESTYANKETCLYRRDNVARPKVEYIEKYSRRVSGVWVDVGSGIGDVPAVALERGWIATGLELSESSVRFADETFGLKLVRKTLGDFVRGESAARSQTDVVSLIGIIEHVVDPLGMLRQAHELLRTGGTVAVQVPHAGSFAGWVQKVYPENVFRHLNPVDHIMVFSRPSLERALRQTGFEPVAMWYHGLDVYELLNSLILTNPRVQGSELAGAFYRLMNEMQLVIDRQELSNSILCVARKA